MGFPASDYGLVIPKLLSQFAFTLAHLKTAICWALQLVGLDESEEPESSSWQDFPENPLGFPSDSADTLADSLPIVTFGQFAERLTEMRDDDHICAVCLSRLEEEDEIRELSNCFHVFHRDCLDKWVDCDQTTCPLCRSSLALKTVLDEEVNNESWVIDHIAYLFGEDLVFSS